MAYFVNVIVGEERAAVDFLAVLVDQNFRAVGTKGKTSDVVDFGIATCGDVEYGLGCFAVNACLDDFMSVGRKGEQSIVVVGIHERCWRRHAVVWIDVFAEFLDVDGRRAKCHDCGKRCGEKSDFIHLTENDDRLKNEIRKGRVAGRRGAVVAQALDNRTHCFLDCAARRWGREWRRASRCRQVRCRWPRF